MSDCVNCAYESDIKELKRDAERNSEQHREFYAKFNQHDKSIAISEERYTNLLSVMTEVKTSVNELKEKPTKRWDSIVTYIITTVLGLVIGMLVNGMIA